MWFLPKISWDAENAVSMLASIEKAARNLDDKKVVDAIKYTYGCRKRGTGSWVLVFPGHDDGIDPIAEGWEPWFGEEDYYEDWENYPFDS